MRATTRDAIVRNALLVGPVVLFAAPFIPERTRALRALRLTAMVFGGVTTIVGAWKRYAAQAS